MIYILYIISFLTRLIFLLHGHPSITHDEADYFINSYLLAKSGTDIFSQRFFLTSGILNSTSGVLVYIGSIFFNFFGKSIFTGRLPYAILNSLIPVLFYQIINKLTKNKILSLIGFFVLNFSPWFAYLSAMSAFDSPIALTFYLLSFYILLIDIKPKLKYFLFIIFSFLSFNSYMGIKTIFPLLLTLALVTKDIYEKKKINIFLIIKKFFISLFIFLMFFFSLYLFPGSKFFQSRLNEKILPLNLQTLTGKVNFDRSLSAGPKILISALHNKITAYIVTSLEKYVLAFNPLYLFIKGDPHPIYGTNYFGLFYLLDGIFLIVGLININKIFKNNLLAPILFIFLFIISPIPNVLMIDSANIAVRALPIILPYSFFIAVGLYSFLDYLIKNKKYIIPCSFLLYFVSFLSFLFVFGITIKSASAEQWHRPEKDIIEKIVTLKDRYKNIYIFNGEPKETILLYDFYNLTNEKKIRKNLNLINGQYVINNVIISSNCNFPSLDKMNLYLIKVGHCEIDKRMKEKNFPYKADLYMPSYYQINLLDKSPLK